MSKEGSLLDKGKKPCYYKITYCSILPHIFIWTLLWFLLFEFLPISCISDRIIATFILVLFIFMAFNFLICCIAFSMDIRSLHNDPKILHEQEYWKVDRELRETKKCLNNAKKTFKNPSSSPASIEQSKAIMAESFILKKTLQNIREEQDDRRVIAAFLIVYGRAYVQENHLEVSIFKHFIGDENANNLPVHIV